jgi:hypothetical protein
MSDTKNTGGPAFPTRFKIPDGTGGRYTITENGMTLRDHFASTATEGDIQYYQKAMTRELIISRSQARYLHADAMLNAREQ